MDSRESTKNLYRQAGAAWTLLGEVKRLIEQLDEKQAEIDGLKQNVEVREAEVSAGDSHRLIFAHQALIWGDALLGCDYGLADPELFDKTDTECEGMFRVALRKYAEVIGVPVKRENGEA